MESSLVAPHHHFLDPLVEDLSLLLREDLSWGPLVKDLSLPLAATSVLGAVLGVVLTLVVADAVLNLTPVACQGGNTCCLYGVAGAASCPTEAACCWMADEGILDAGLGQLVLVA